MEKWFSVIRDSVILAAAIFGLVYSQVTGVISTELVAAYVTLLGTPGVLNILEIRRRSTKDSSTESNKDSSSSQD